MSDDGGIGDDSGGVVRRLLRDALLMADELRIESLSGEGRKAIDALAAYLLHQFDLGFPPGKGKAIADNLMWVSCQLAARLPNEYLAVFNFARWQTESCVLEGLGYTRSAEARPILIDALFGEGADMTRLDAASALGMIPGVESITPLLRALDDSEYLVRYQAIVALGKIGNEAALERLRSLADSPELGIAAVARQAVETLSIRLRLD
jgi:hypothetical protein